MKRDVTRKQFLHLSLGATAAAILLPACGGDDGDDTGAGTDATTGGTDPTTEGSTNPSDATVDPSTSGDPTVDPSTSGDPTVDPSTSGTGTESTGAVDTTDGESGTTGGGACTSDPTAEIGSNHAMGPHAMTVSLAEVEAGVEVQYNIMGASGHPHTVVLTAEDFATLQATGSVVVESSTDAMHSHTVTVTCA